MDLLPTDEEREIAAAAAAFLEKELPVSRLRDPDRAALPAETWRALAALGWFGLGLPEVRGGAGFTLAEETLLFREVGRFLGPPSLLASALAARVADAGDDAPLRDAVLGGERRVGWALPRDPAAEPLSGPHWLLDAQGADLVLCLGEAGAALLDTAALPAGEPHPCLDEAVTLQGVELNGAAARVWVPEAREALALRATVLVCAMLVGIAEATRDMAVAYAKERRQFGKPIGVFQAVKHRCADMAVACEAAGSLLLYAALAVRDGLADAPFQVSAAKAVATDAALANARANIQLHGGYGYTDESGCHHFLKRAHVLDLLAGPLRAHLTTVLAAPRA